MAEPKAPTTTRSAPTLMASSRSQTRPSAATLDGIALVLVNGGDGQEYAREALTGSLAAGGYLTSRSRRRTGRRTASRSSTPRSGTLLDALSYEGEITAATIDGQTYDLVEGTALAADVATRTRSRVALSHPRQQDTNNAAADWAFTQTHTKGAANVASPYGARMSLAPTTLPRSASRAGRGSARAARGAPSSSASSRWSSR